MEVWEYDMVAELKRERDEERQHKESYFKAGREAEIEVAALRQRVEEQDRLLDEHERAFERQVERAEAAEAAHKEAAAQWQDEARLRREAEAKLARCVEALEEVVVNLPSDFELSDVARAALAAVKA